MLTALRTDLLDGTPKVLSQFLEGRSGVEFTICEPANKEVWEGAFNRDDA